MPSTSQTTGSEALAPSLHLGCFDHVLDGWHNTDVTPHLWIARVPGAAGLLYRLGLLSATRRAQHAAGLFRRVHYLNVARRFPFPDGTFSAAYCSHMLEHLTRDRAEACVREIHRVLKPGGVFRASVPDLDRFVAAYDPGDADAWMTMLLESDQVRDKNRHHWMYNERSLSALFRRAGFADPVRRGYREGACPGIAAFELRPDSLFLEAVR